MILKVLDRIPDKLSGPGAEEANLHKLKSLYTSCKDVVCLPAHASVELNVQDKLNEVGLEPFLPHVKTLLDLFGPFDLIPAPEAEVADVAAEWWGTWTDDFRISPALIASAENVQTLKQAKSNGGMKWVETAPRNKVQLEDEALDERLSEDEKSERLTKTLAWLHSRGERSPPTGSVADA